MRKNLLLLVFLCAIAVSFTACKDAEADAKEAGAAYCRVSELGRQLVRSETQKKEITALNKKISKIRVRYYNKTLKKTDEKFEEAYAKYKAACK